MPFGYPVMLELAGRRCVVIGELAVREGKVEGLVAAGADDIVVVAPRPEDRLGVLTLMDGVAVRRRGWRPEDLDGAFLVVASSPEPAERTAIAREARRRQALVNVMDDIPNCDWSAPGVVRRGELVVAIATGGASPALSRKWRAQLSSAFGAEWAEVRGVLRPARTEPLASLPDLRPRAPRWAAALDPDEAVGLVRAGRGDELATRLRTRLLQDVPS
jgi:precorrin-2 dehydrogenase/sirohydrochlorin ferrochelatase